MDEAAAFRAVITMEAGEPIISWAPRLTAEEEAKRTYTVYGREDLLEGAWTPVTGDNRSRMRFFRVTVEMRRGL